jgi:hypothetical protein
MSSSSDNSNAPLPKGWSRGYSKSQLRFYYSHVETKHTQWHFPTASEAADPLKGKRRSEENQERERQKAKAANNNNTKPQQQAVEAGGSSSQQQQQQLQQSSKPPPAKRQRVLSDPDAFLALADTTCVAIIVPYRDLHPAQGRAAHLAQFVPHMTKLLNKLVKDGRLSNYHIYIVEQSNDGRKFNRGKLLNIGFDLARKNTNKLGVALAHDVFIFHDVDLLPQDDLSDAYSQFPKTPYHIARVWDRYSNNPKYFGGVVSFSSSDYKRINGYPNTFWGWGGEDDEMQKRCEKLGIKWEYPSTGSGTLVDLEQMNLTEKLDFLRQNKEWKCMVKWEALEEHESTWKTNGLADLKYQVLKTEFLGGGEKDIKKAKASKITVDVKLNASHWANEKCGVDFKGDWDQKK